MTIPIQRVTVLLSLLSCSLVFGCEQEGPRVYTAMPFDATQGCLGAYAPLGLVEADELPATCAPVCLLQSDALYVSTVCAPYPAEATVVSPSDSSDCESALAVLEMDGGGACQTD
jgi:hypothetical protein